jgi:RimJ/RimL family protein N-acetyltransferase
MPDVRVLATGLEFPEGPVVMPDGSVVLVEIRGQRLTRVWPDGAKEVVAQIPGGPNGAAIGPDGKCYICNNGGFSWIASRGTMMPGAPGPHEYLGGSIQRVDLSTGKVETLFDKCGEHPLKGPNDLVFDRHGGLWFTDLGKRRARDMDVGAFYYIKPGMNVDAANRRVEIGSTWYARRVQRSALNTQCKWLLLTHAFEQLDCIAVEFRTHFFNHQSRRGIERLGAKLDGILRSHQIAGNGTLRDTVVYSIVAAEWPTVKAHLNYQLNERAR